MTRPKKKRPQKTNRLKTSSLAHQRYSITVEAYLDGTILGSSSGNIACRYVRREMRQLFDDDRTRLLDTMKTLWSTRTTDGQQLYGPSYVDVYDLAHYHVTLSSDISCDHMHDGLGFLPQVRTDGGGVCACGLLDEVAK